MAESTQPIASNDIIWTPEALQRMEREPAFLRGMVKRLAEKKARELGYGTITGEILDQFKGQMMGSMGGSAGMAEAASQMQAGRLPWTAAAQARLDTVPEFMRGMIKQIAEELAREHGHMEVNVDLIEKVEAFVDEDNASRMAAFIAGKYDLGWEFPGTINRVDWVQMKDTLKQRRPNLKTAEFPSNVMTHLYFRNDKPPFNDVRVRRAMSMAIDRKGIIDAVAEGVGVLNPAVPAALKEWSIPPDQLGEGAQYFKYDPAAARKLLAEAGHPKGFPVTIDFTTYGSQVLIDACQLVLKNLKDVGIEAKLNTKEYGAYISSTFYGKYESMALGPQTPYLEPDNFLYGQYYPGELKNHGYVNDPVLADLLVRQRRTLDPTKRREIIFEAQRHIAKQQYYVQLWSGVYVAVWDGALANYGPNLGYDYGGRLMAAWLDR